MPRFRLAERAKADLRAIGRYTQATWGREQQYIVKYTASTSPERFQIIWIPAAYAETTRCVCTKGEC
jgi:hypothetical protein